MTISGEQIRTLEILGMQVTVDDQLGKLCIAHSGVMTWDCLQWIKNFVWGDEARAIEVFPRHSDVVNNGNFRHLWRLGEGDFCPDLLSHKSGDIYDIDRLQDRHHQAWAEAEAALPGQARVWAQSGSEFK